MSLKHYLSSTKYIIEDYFESEYPWFEDGRPPRGFVPDNPGGSGLCEAETENCAYLPVLAREASLKPFPFKRGTSYYYADGQRIAMRTGGEAYLLFGDHLGSSSVVMKANGEVVEKAYYLPWGGERGDTSITSTDYGYTGQMREGDIYYYGARWYDPSIGRFMQADTIVPLNVQGTQAFDRYAYVNNNPMMYVDSSGHFAITTAFLIGAAVGAVVNYGAQVVQNMQQGMDFTTALTTDISVGNIAVSAGIGAVGGLLMGGVGTTAIPAIAKAAAGVVGTAGAAIKNWLCFDGDCGNEISEAGQAGKEIIQTANNGLNPVSQIRANYLKGQLGEALSGWPKNTIRISSLTNTANYRIPDFLDDKLQILGEVKNVNFLGVTNQLRDFALYAEKLGYQFVIKTSAVKFSGSFGRFVKEFGIIVEKLR